MCDDLGVPFAQYNTDTLLVSYIDLATLTARENLTMIVCLGVTNTSGVRGKCLNGNLGQTLPLINETAVPLVPKDNSGCQCPASMLRH